MTVGEPDGSGGLVIRFYKADEIDGPDDPGFARTGYDGRPIPRAGETVLVEDGFYEVRWVQHDFDDDINVVVREAA